MTSDSERRHVLRRLEDCAELLEAAQTLHIDVISPRLTEVLCQRVPAIRAGMTTVEGLAAVRSLEAKERAARPLTEDRRVRHRRPAFDPGLILAELGANSDAAAVSAHGNGPRRHALGGAGAAATE